MTAARPSRPTRPPADRGAALVTGATSGIGRALAVELARRGNDVLVVADRDVEPTVRDLSAHGGTHEGLTVDLATPRGVEATARQARDLGVSTVVLNAGVGVHGAFARTPLEDQLRLLDLNVRSVAHLTHLLLPDLLAEGRGRILVTSSVAGEMPAPHFAAYAASKAFLRSFAWSLRGELAGTGVTVTTLLPGPTRTPFFREAGMERTHVGRLPKPRPAAAARRAVDALLHGRPEVVTGVQGGVMLAAARVLPQPARAAFHGWFYAPVPASLAAARPSSSPLR
ncbi:SDR family NAD(P)-dependent oxidoreductase [Cellulosimicrobium cellulans]|uniref:SDR family NAD(P)-dependent oxidoreductase n=1 Tax=Cellulosimicrobium cellulans TaxID=1710 RepID=UPI0036E65E2D